MKRVLFLFLFFSSYVVLAQNNCTQNKVDNSSIECNGFNQISLKNTAVTPGSYTNSNITVNSKGQITSASNGTGGAGTVTFFSSGNLSPLFSTSVATATSTPTLSFSLSSVSSGNLIFASPNGSGGVPSFRALAATDIPSLDSLNIALLHSENYFNTKYYPLSSNPAGYLTSVTLDSTTISGFHSANYYNTIFTPLTRTLTINGSAQDLSSNRTWNVGTVTSVAATAGTGISISGSPVTTSGTLTITNTAPDQTVSLTGGTNVTVTGTYPNFTISATSAECSPDTFTFTTQTGAQLNALTTSNSVILSGDSTCIWDFLIRGDGSPQLKINSDSWSTGAHARYGDTLTVRTTSSSSANTSIVARIYCNNFTSTFTVTTINIDADAAAFLVAAGITDATITNAIHNLVTNLKSHSIWTKAYAIYPMVGGTSTTTKYNLKDPRDLDAAYRITWNGTSTFASTGVKSNGSTGYGNTHLNPSTTFSANSVSLGFHSRTNAANGSDLSVRSGSSYVELNSKFDDNLGYSLITNALTNYVSTSVSNATGFFTATKTASNRQDFYRNGTSLANNTASENLTSYVNNTMDILARNEVGTGHINFSPRECSFAWIGQGLSSTEVSNLNSDDSTFQSDLSR